MQLPAMLHQCRNLIISVDQACFYLTSGAETGN